MKAYLYFIGLIFISQSLFARPLSIAKTATVTTSSELNKQFVSQNINDGIIAVDSQGNWMAKENRYIQKVKLNVTELTNFWFYLEDFARCGELEIWLDDKPNKNWGLQNYPPVN